MAIEESVWNFNSVVDYFNWVDYSEFDTGDWKLSSYVFGFSQQILSPYIVIGYQLNADSNLEDSIN